LCFGGGVVVDGQFEVFEADGWCPLGTVIVAG
jgi:hypothetical protein